MRITSFQSVQVADALVAGQPLRQDNAFVDETLAEAYIWMRSQMSVFGKPPPDDDALLLWGWPKGHEPTEDTLSPEDLETRLRVILELSEAEFLLSDFQAWHLVLNSHYLASSEADDAAPSVSREGSWARIFTPEALDEDYWGSRAQRIYQACFWQPAPRAVLDVSPIATCQNTGKG